MVLARLSKTAGGGGGRRALGSASSRPRPMLEAHLLRSSSIAPPSPPAARPAGKKGEAAQEIGRSRGGRTTKFHALAVVGDKGYDRNAVRRPSERARRLPEHFADEQQKAPHFLVPELPPRPQRHPTDVWQAQGLPPHRHKIRPQGRRLPLCRHPSRDRRLLAMSPEPRTSAARVNKDGRSTSA